MPLTILTNMPGLAGVARPGVDVQIVQHERASGLLAHVRNVKRALACDYALINCSPRDLFYYSAVKLAVPFSRLRVVSLDTVLPVPKPSNSLQRMSLRLKRLLFTRVHLFLEYFRDTGGYERHYGIPHARFRYVPFKVNRYERILEMPVSDDGYIFCGGNTRRDFGTLLEVARRVPYAVKVVTMQDAVIRQHGSSLDSSALPGNVQLIRHDGSDSFLGFIARARLVVLPILRENISASGIGVYLASMALGKCVVISAGPAVNGVIPEGAAIIVPPEDPLALAAAIERAYGDSEYRQAIADRGQQYALGLQGEQRLCESVMDVILADRRPGPASSPSTSSSESA